MKLCVIGGAGARSAFLTKSLVKSAREIRVEHIVLLDNNEEHLRTYGQISKELARRMEPSLTFDITSDARGALTGADYIITTIRAGGDAGRLFDEKTCLAHGVLGQETTTGTALLRFCECLWYLRCPQRLYQAVGGNPECAIRCAGY